MSKNRTGNYNSIYKTLGASSHTDNEREHNDYYATDPISVDLLLQNETFDNIIRETACGEGHISKRLIELGCNVFSSDLIYRGYGEQKDFLKHTDSWEGHIITNPPYKYGLEFVEKSLEIIPNGNKVCMFLKVQFMEGKKRKKLFLKNPPRTIYISSSRLKCAKNGYFDSIGSSALAYAWYVWEKGYRGDSIVKRIN